ncbi:unnamed protein product [Thelazia callipaeda]|uniref:BESS domain-containing protein n=1 Tax=Thelazia callipaeda TaxID=103827 RepID=A0A0N5CS91_THECL|nr:unnamed protein product [Thelazia callipaeda]
MPLAYTASGSDAVLYPQHSDIPLISVPNPSSSSQDNTTTIYTKNQNSAVYSSQYYQQSIPLSQQQQQYSQKILQYQPPYPTTAQARSNPSISDALLLALRRRPTARLFRALFQYIPIRDSPNENPHLELPLQVF